MLLRNFCELGKRTKEYLNKTTEISQISFKALTKYNKSLRTYRPTDRPTDRSTD
jgi:hypothetical protein